MATRSGGGGKYLFTGAHTSGVPVTEQQQHARGVRTVTKITLRFAAPPGNRPDLQTCGRVDPSMDSKMALIGSRLLSSDPTPTSIRPDPGDRTPEGFPATARGQRCVRVDE